MNWEEEEEEEEEEERNRLYKELMQRKRDRSDREDREKTCAKDEVISRLRNNGAIGVTTETPEQTRIRISKRYIP